jgi:carbon-monoxide dehydrogenase medium subunit
MTDSMKPFDYFEPDHLDEALELLHLYGNRAKVLAGGTDLIVQMKERKLSPQVVVSLRRLKELDFIEMTPGWTPPVLRLGPTTLLSTLAAHPLFDGRLEMLREAALAVGDLQIRNMATLGGNIANASPSADMIPGLIALGAKIRLQKKAGERVLDLADLFVAPFTTRMEPEEILTEILVKPLPEGRGVYLWMPKHTAVDETLVGVAAWLACGPGKRICQKVSLAFGSVSPLPMRARRAEAFLQGKELNHDLLTEAGEIASQEVSPRSRADYRRRIVSILTERALEESWKRVENG